MGPEYDIAHWESICQAQVMALPTMVKDFTDPASDIVKQEVDRYF